MTNCTCFGISRWNPSREREYFRTRKAGDCAREEVREREKERDRQTDRQTDRDGQ